MKKLTMKKTILFCIFALVLSSCGIFRKTETKADAVTFAQDESEFWAENFIAEVFLGNRVNRHQKFYLRKEKWWLCDVSFRSMRGRIDDTLFDEFFEIIFDNLFTDNLPTRWNTQAPVFRQPKFENLIFLYGRAVIPTKWICSANLSSPIITQNGEFVFLAISEGCGGFTYGFSTLDYVIYRKVDGKWVVYYRMPVFVG